MMYNADILVRLDRIEAITKETSVRGWIDIKKACIYTSLSASTIRRAIHSGKLKYSKPGGKLMFKIEWLERFMNNKRKI